MEHFYPERILQVLLTFAGVNSKEEAHGRYSAPVWNDFEIKVSS